MIETTYLTELADYTNNKIAKVVINKELEITVFGIKRVSSSKVELDYMIPNGSVAEATLIELKSSSDQVITSNAIYVPITSDTIIKQTIQVKEI